VGLLLNSDTGSLFAGRHDPERERPAPPLPTSVSFPDIDDISCARPVSWTAESSPDLFQQYARIRKPADITLAHLEVLNINFHSVDILDHLTSDAGFVPSPSWLDPAELSDTSKLGSTSRVLSSGRTCPTQHDFYTRSTELQHENENGFRALSRRPSNGKPPPRLAHFRRFWEGLDTMASYWDTTSEEYFPPKIGERGDEELTGAKSPEDLSYGGGTEVSALDENDHEPRKRTKPNPDDPELIAPSEKFFPHRPVQDPISSSVLAAPRIQPPELPVGHPARNKFRDIAPEGTYRGNRIGNGAAMPDQHRIDTVRAFVEPIAWAFGFTIAGHRRPTNLKVGNLLIPMKVTSAVWQAPKQRDRARLGWLEGPVMGISCRGETEFADGRADPVIDVLREVGALLLIAQERARQGKSEAKPGEGKWWTTVPRWGGGPGDGPAVVNAPPAPDTIAAATEQLIRESEAKTSLESRARPLTRGQGNSRRKMTAAETWNALRPGAGFWDPRVEYTAIGKPANSDYDEVRLPHTPQSSSLYSYHTGLSDILVEPPYQHFEAQHTLRLPGVFKHRTVSFSTRTQRLECASHPAESVVQFFQRRR
jgi:hypothetical protein